MLEVEGKVLSLRSRLVLREGTTPDRSSPDLCDWGLL
jgi:hypothetical protein